MHKKVLVLNQNYEPMSICSVKKAIILLYLGKAELVEAREGQFIRSVSITMPFPSIVRLSFYVQMPYRRVVLTRRNILKRDGYRCQYCGKTGVPLTVDHVIPKSRGGEDSWENLVCACIKCNNKKGDRTPEEAGMKLLRKPRKPNPILFIRHFVGEIDEKWEPYLFMK